MSLVDETHLTDVDAYQILNALPGLGPVTVRALLDQIGNPKNILSASEAALRVVPRVGPAIVKALQDWASYINLEEERGKMAEADASFISLADRDKYPALLQEIYDPPLGLYIKGDVLPRERCVAIVGSRRSTLYGVNTAKKIAQDLGRLGFCVVSGLARGIDAAAHRGALEVGGATVAVLGCGVDRIYPPENKDLYQEMAKKGALMSEFRMGRRADRQTFPMRNRIIAGLSEATIVIESDVHGGSMITARLAGESGRLVCAVPGRIDQASSRGCHRLIREGAVLLRSVDDLLEELQYASQLNLLEPETKTPKLNLDPKSAQVLHALKEMSIADVDALAENTGMMSSDVSAALLMLELKKTIVRRADGTFEAQ
ncbi:MAG: DNA-processing protein DprA [Opitutales bacterium]